MIKKLKLKNWKCHLDSSFEFGFGTNALLGVMGAGKSSVLEAISFALFGTFPALQQRKIKLEDVIMKKPVRKDFAEVELEFELNGNTYSVKRRIERRKATQAELRINGKLVEAQPQRVNEFIEDVLKMDFDLFTRAIYSEQNRIDAFLNLPKGQRIKKIDEILKLEKFEQARASTVALANRFKALNAELARFISTLRGEVNESELEALKQEIRKIEEETDKLAKLCTALEKQLEQKERERKHLFELRKRKETLEKLLHGLLSQITVLEREIREKTLPDPEEVRERILNISKELNEVEEARSNLECRVRVLRRKKEEAELELREISEAKKKIEKLREEEKEVAEKLREEKKIEGEMHASKTRLEHARKEYFSLLARKKEAEKSLHELLKAGDVCPVCEAELSEAAKARLIEKRKNEIEEIENEMAEMKNEIEKLEARADELEKKYFAVCSLKEKIKAIKNELAALEKKTEAEGRTREKIKILESEIEKFEREREKLEEKFRELRIKLEREKIAERELQEFEKKRKELEEKKFRAGEMEKELAGIVRVFSEERLEKLTEETRNLYGKLSGLRAKLAELGRLKEEKMKRSQEMEKKLKDLKKYEEEKRKVEQIISDLEKLKDALLRTQEELRKNFIAAINQAMQAIWEELYPYGDFQSIRLSVQEGDYVLQLQELDGSWVSAEHVSGGERTLAALTLRIAFALVLAPQLRWLILDEPTHNLDIKAREELARVLRERITEFIDQVFLITHDPILEDAVSGVLYRIEREKEKNGTAKVIKVEER